MKSVEWEQWLPPELIPKRRPAGVVAIYKISGIFRIFKDSFSGLAKGSGFLDLEEESWKFITLYFPTAQTEKQQRLGFRLYTEKMDGALDLAPCSEGGFRISLKHVLPDLGYKGFLGKTSYFKVQYDGANEMHYIELGKPDFEWKKRKGFYPSIETE